MHSMGRGLRFELEGVMGRPRAECSRGYIVRGRHRVSRGLKGATKFVISPTLLSI